ncbi:hypothetical protein BDE02_17G059300 [Populus trichocarpa]|nr:hypothetical protein BDE02_17G059300 [Populus trichocarpa]
MEAALPEEALKPSKVHLDRRLAWRVYVKSAGSIYEMIQATIILEEMIKTDYLRNEWCTGHRFLLLPRLRQLLP